MKALKVLLVLAAVICLAGLAGVVLPMRFISPLAKWYGMGEGSGGPFFVYTFRMAAAVIAGCSVFFFLLSLDPGRHGALVPAAGGLFVFVGTVLMITGFSTGMLPYAVLMDGLSCTLVGGGIVLSWLLWGRGGKG
ncbi:MAG: hypothetical protein ACYS47_09865 [Planctomycetota bacterium]|jgi:hypothetical protein